MPQNYATGTIVLGRYVIDGLLGEGGMGAVYLAHHVELVRKRFAVKVLRPDRFADRDVERRFRREAEVLSTLSHPGIVSIVDFGMDDAAPVMVMEHLEGETLRARLMRERTLSLAETLRIVREVASALGAAHGCDPPVIHRDLKPDNLMLVGAGGHVKVLDFGIAKVLGHETFITRASIALGTPQYMSPEQLRDARGVDVATDQWALASIAYECLAGVYAFPGEGFSGVVFAVFDKPRPLVSHVRPELPAALDAVLARAWAVDATKRFGSVTEFAEAFARAAEGESDAGASRTAAPTMPARAGRSVRPVASDPGTPKPTTVRPPSNAHHMSVAPLLVGAAVAVLAVVAGLVFAWTRDKTTSPSNAAPTTHPAPIAAPPPPVDATAAAAPVVDAGDAIDMLRASLERRVRACGTSRTAGRRADVRVTWRDGLPVNITVDHSLAAPVRACISRTFVEQGRLSPPNDGAITRELHFQLP